MPHNFGKERLLRTAGGRWVRNHDAQRYYNGDDHYAFLTNEQAQKWLLASGADEAEGLLEKYFPETPAESGPQGGRPAIGAPINVAYPADLLRRIDAAAAKADMSRAAWLRNAAENAVSAAGF
jgi:hypothetical protein